MKALTFDFNNLFSSNVGKDHGAMATDVARMSAAARQAHAHLVSILRNDDERIGLNLEWTRLPYQSEKTVAAIETMASGIRSGFDAVVSLGIGGSYLGLKAAQDALLPPYYNEFASLRNRCPRIYFDGNNLDPHTLAPLLRNLNPKRTFVIVISKSGETSETKAAFTVVEAWLKKDVGRRYGRQIVAITDPRSGTLRKKVTAEQAKDPLSFRDLPVMQGVGGRFSELNIGLLHLAVIGIDIRQVLAGARAMHRRCSSADPYRNPALMYAVLHTILYRRKGKPIAVMMPFSEGLKSTADWYVQLLAESLGKKYARKIVKCPDGAERWENDLTRVVHVGRTPIPARGTNDLHSIQQNNIEGQNDKVVTFVRVDTFASDIKIPGAGDLLSGRYYSKLLSLAQEATEWALVRGSRPNCTIRMPEISPYHWGEMLFFFEMATAYEGELLGVNAFDQPGVEGYKNYMYYKLRKPGIPKELERDIRSHPLRKTKRLII